jgi:glycosyltransferase involved in cell wall biosynthesis
VDDWLGVTWGLSAYHGWGVFGSNLCLELLERGAPKPLLLRPTDASLLAPPHRARLAPLLAEHDQLMAMVRQHGGGALQLNNATILFSYGNDFLANPASEQFRGRRNIGFTFFEGTRFSDAVIESVRWLDGFLVGSRWNQEILNKRGLGPVRLVHQGIDGALFRPGPRRGRYRDRFVIFSGGKLEYRKGQDIALAAFKAFHARHPDAVLVTMWQNPWPQFERTVLESRHVRSAPDPNDPPNRRIVRWAVREGVHEDAFVDLRTLPNSELPSLLREAAVAVFPNRCEGGTNLVAMEAMACGVPCLLSANTGHLDLIDDARCYALRDQRPVDDPTGERDGWGESAVEELVEVLERIYADRAEAETRGRRAAEFMAGWSWRHQIDRLLQTLDAFG